jgi:hypothetical protein
MTIDWNKPVETCEEPPRPVEILTTKVRGKYPVFGHIGDSDNTVYRWTLGGYVFAGNTHSKLNLRNKIWKLPDLPSGTKWHRDDWREDMLPPGYRPLLKNEKVEGSDEALLFGFWKIIKESILSAYISTIPKGDYYVRTTRPLPKLEKLFCAGDVPPGSVFKKHDVKDGFCNVEFVVENGVALPGYIWSWEALAKTWLIKRPGEDWKPCYHESY